MNVSTKNDVLLIPDYAIDIVMKGQITIKYDTQGYFLDDVIVNYYKIKKQSKCLILKEDNLVIDFYCRFWVNGRDVHLWRLPT